MRNEKIIMKDPIYKQILVDKKIEKYLDSPEFQRLKYIKQTSFAYQVYPSANHTRFSHSLGAYHLMKKVLQNGLMDMSKKKKDELELAALLHDIGHGPYSHLWEKVFPHFDHEDTTQEILKQWGLTNVANILKKKDEFSALITSSLDVDKLDYMARDSYFSGVSYGLLEVDFIMQHVYVKDSKYIIKPSALSSVEDLITQRINLFKTVYFHKVSLEFDIIFENIFTRAIELYKKKQLVLHNKHIESFFKKTNTTSDLLKLTDDIIFAQLMEWTSSEDPILSDLSQRFIYRKKLKAINLSHKSVSISNIKKAFKNSKYDIRYYFKLVKVPIQVIQTQLYVETKNGITPIEKVSKLIQFYKTQKFEVECVFFPKEFEEKL
jgi:HD superfamily phosphohydrolase